MIFVTVGTQLPFDRLVATMDRWARGCDEEIFAQIGNTAFYPTTLRFAALLPPPEFDARFTEARLVVSHAGMGTVLKAIGSGKPLIVMPRRRDLGEHRNNHQCAIAAHLSSLGVHVAANEDELRTLLGRPDVHTLAAPRKLELPPQFRNALASMAGGQR